CRIAIERRASAVIDALPEIRGYITSDLVQMLALDKEASVSRLKTIASNDVLGRAGVNAAIFLCRLLQPDGLRYVRSAIEEGSLELKTQALEGIALSLLIDPGGAAAQRNFWLSDKLLVRAVLQLLDHADAKVLDKAVIVCGGLRLD